ncbi:MAG: hypothetical protein U0R50_05935 [Gaiellales bacterium]
MRWPGRARSRRLFGDPRAWFVAALIGDGLLWLAPDDEASRLRVFDPALLLVAFALWLADDRLAFRRRLRAPGAIAAAAFVALGVAAGLIYELALAKGGDGYGGLHQDTKTSFLLFPGYYVVAPIAMLLLIRRYRLDRREAFFTAACFAVYEAVTIGLPALVSPFFFLAPFLIAYYATVYSVIVAFGVLMLPEPSLHSERTGARRPLPRVLAAATAAGLGVWVVFLGWALLLEAAGVDVF